VWLSDRLQSYQISRYAPSSGEWVREAFADHAAAVRFLRRLRGDASTTLRLRAIYSQETGRYDLSRASDDEVIERLASQVVSRRLSVWRPVTTGVGVPESSRTTGGPSVATPPPGSPSRPAPPVPPVARDAPPPPPAPPLRRPTRAEPKPKTWVEVVLVGEDDRPISGKRYMIKLPDGSVRSGFLNQRGTVRLAEIDPGDVEIRFPELDQDAWEPA
jgi:hypothetical protein